MCSKHCAGSQGRLRGNRNTSHSQRTRSLINTQIAVWQITEPQGREVWWFGDHVYQIKWCHVASSRSPGTYGYLRRDFLHNSCFEKWKLLNLLGQRNMTCIERKEKNELPWWSHEMWEEWNITSTERMYKDFCGTGVELHSLFHWTTFLAFFILRQGLAQLPRLDWNLKFSCRSASESLELQLDFSTFKPWEIH